MVEVAEYSVYSIQNEPYIQSLSERCRVWIIFIDNNSDIKLILKEEEQHQKKNHFVDFCAGLKVLCTYLFEVGISRKIKWDIIFFFFCFKDTIFVKIGKRVYNIIVTVKSVKSRFN